MIFLFYLRGGIKTAITAISSVLQESVLLCSAVRFPAKVRVDWKQEQFTLCTWLSETFRPNIVRSGEGFALGVTANSDAINDPLQISASYNCGTN